MQSICTQKWKSTIEDTMKQDTHTKLNWMKCEQLKTILENYGFGVNPDESEDDLKAAIIANIEDGTIPEDEI